MKPKRNLDKAPRRALETEKLRYELRELQRPWWQRHIVALVTAVVTILGSAYAVMSGFFDLESKRLEVNKALLQQDIAAFTMVRDSLFSVNTQKIRSNDSLSLIAAALRREAQEQKAVAYQRSVEIAKLQASVQPASERAAYYERAVKEAQKRYSDKESKLFDESAKQFNSSYELGLHVSELQAQIDRLKEDTSSQGHVLRNVLRAPILSKVKAAELRKWYVQVNEIYKPNYNFSLGDLNYRIKRDSTRRANDSILHRLELQMKILAR